MEFIPNDDQAAVFGALDQIMAAPEAAWAVRSDLARFDWSPGLDATLEENGFFDAAAEDTLGLAAAAEIVFRLATLPVLVEGAASAFLRALYCPDLPRPLAVIDGDEGAGLRFLPVAKSVIRLDPAGIGVATLGPDAVEPVDSLFAYPMGRLRPGAVTWTRLDADPAQVIDAWRVAVAAEIAGSLKGGMDSVVEHVRERRQFGRALGSFQGIQHRLADAAAKIEGARLLVLRAAQRIAPADAAVALGYVQRVATAVIYDLHQFMGAMGVTLEHPLHRWTYRARLLRSSIGGADENFRQVSARLWGQVA